MMNEELLKAYRQGYRDGREDAKKEMNYQNFPPVYYGGIGTGSNPTGSAGMGTPTGGLSYSMNDHFVTGMSHDNVGC